MAQSSFSQIAFRGAIEANCNPNRNPIKPIVGIALFSWRHRQTLNVNGNEKRLSGSIVAMLQVSSFVGKDLRFFPLLVMNEWAAMCCYRGWFNHPWVASRRPAQCVIHRQSISDTQNPHTSINQKAIFFSSHFFSFWFDQSRNFLLAFLLSHTFFAELVMM